MSSKNDQRFDVIIDASDPQFAVKLADAIGVLPGGTVEIITPQFDREDGVWPVFPDFNFANLPSYPEATIRALGCRPWDEPDADGVTLWLFPAEWYNHIPKGMLITDIFGEIEAFEPGVTDDDRRFGMLSYGFTRKAQEGEANG